jgi:hypothetical protein
VCCSAWVEASRLEDEVVGVDLVELELLVESSLVKMLWAMLVGPPLVGRSEPVMAFSALVISRITWMGPSLLVRVFSAAVIWERRLESMVTDIFSVVLKVRWETGVMKRDAVGAATRAVRRRKDILDKFEVYENSWRIKSFYFGEDGRWYNGINKLQLNG